ncbi:MAG: transglutaminase domain-containing protein [bacterium]|nr:transglutaminase domain-containing protein [bacterium]
MREIYAVTTAIILFASISAADIDEVAERTVEIEYVANVNGIPEDAENLRLWIPLPQDSDHQEITDITVESPHPYSLHITDDYGNKVLYVETEKAGTEFEIAVRFTAKRIANVRGTYSAEELDRSLTLSAQVLVPLNDEIKEMALAAIKTADDSLRGGEILYYHTYDQLVYDKSGEGWGRGDFYYACDVGKGNCTDFHSYFIGLARNVDIPAYFEIGVSRPPERGEGKTGGYHCWAYFLDEGYWVPVDISEADKHPEFKDYYLGNHDENRIAFSRGRDLILAPPQSGNPLNYFINPYAEVDGLPHDNVSKVVFYRDI